MKFEIKPDSLTEQTIIFFIGFAVVILLFLGLDWMLQNMPKEVWHIAGLAYILIADMINLGLHLLAGVLEFLLKFTMPR